jgi:hypothetical protein
MLHSVSRSVYRSLFEMLHSVSRSLLSYSRSLLEMLTALDFKIECVL